MKGRRVAGLGLILIGLGLLAWVAVTSDSLVQLPAPTATPLWQAEPLVPTARPPTSRTPEPASTSTVSAARLVSRPDRGAPTPDSVRAIPRRSSAAVTRFGVGVPYPPLEATAVERLGLGWYLAWRVIEAPPGATGIEFWQMIRVSEEGFRPDKGLLRRAAQANPGATWIIGNEPDVIWQDNVTPERYAQWYHDLYHFLKETDPTCQVAIGGVSQPTPLRLQYLETILAAYLARYGESMPVDIWNIHNFILREERNGWGVGIPPGLAADQGVLLGVEDTDDLALFKAQIIDFRQWMAERGQRDKPLVVSEYGLLMPTEYGFGPKRVQRFLYGTYDFMLSAADREIGYPADDNRLVQRWAWYSLSDDRYPTGNFIDFGTGELTELGQAHQEYIMKGQ